MNLLMRSYFNHRETIEHQCNLAACMNIVNSPDTNIPQMSRQAALTKARLHCIELAKKQKERKDIEHDKLTIERARRLCQECRSGTLFIVWEWKPNDCAGSEWRPCDICKKDYFVFRGDIPLVLT